MTTPTKILNAELDLSRIVYSDNPSLNPGAVPTKLEGWTLVQPKNAININNAHGFFAEAFKSDTENTIIIAFQGSILIPSPGDVFAKNSLKTTWAVASRDADLAILKMYDDDHPSDPPLAFADALAFTQKVLDANPNAT